MDDDPILRNYLRGIDQHPELSAAESMRLAAMVHDGEQAELELRQHWPENAEELGARIKAGRSARQALVDAHLRLVVRIATDYASDAQAPERLLEIIIEGNKGLGNAIAKFNWDRGFSFDEYARWWIRQSIIKVLR